MRTLKNYLAWAPSVLLAVSLPALAAQPDDPSKDRGPQPLVGQLDIERTGAQQDDQDKRDHLDATAQAATTPAPPVDTELDVDVEPQNVDDARKEARVETTIALNRSLQNSDIRVRVDGTTAVLEGTVDDELHKMLAEDLAMNVDGIDEVDNELEVDEEYARPAQDGEQRTFAQTVEDATTTTAVRSRLLWSRDADGVNTEVETRNGRVTLSGTAESAEAKERAGELARTAWGVNSVVNNITVEPDNRTADADADSDAGDAISDAWITTKVRSSFLTSRWISGTDIEIETNDGVVELSGELDSESERELAIEVAENIRGVRDVDARNLTVVG